MLVENICASENIFSSTNGYFTSPVNFFIISLLTSHILYKLSLKNSKKVFFHKSFSPNDDLRSKLIFNNQKVNHHHHHHQVTLTTQSSLIFLPSIPIIHHF